MALKDWRCPQGAATLKRVLKEQTRPGLCRSNLSGADRLLKGMESWKGWLGNFFSGGDTPGSSAVPTAATKASAASRPAVVSVPPAAAAPAGGGLGLGGLGAGMGERSEEEAALGDLAGVVSDLRAQADALRGEMTSQAAQLETMASDAVKASEQMASNTVRTKALRR